MNPNQMAQQLKHELEQIKWPGGSKAVVFGPRNVFVFAGSVDENSTPPGFPFALVTIDDGDEDDDHPELLTQQFTIAVAAMVAGDPMGEWAIIGGARKDVGKSGGAGVAEISSRARLAVQNLTGVDGVPLVASASSIATPGLIGEGRHLAIETFTVTAQCTSQESYLQPETLTYANGTWNWGEHVKRRFDFLQYRLGYVTGSTPVASPDELEAVVYTGVEPTTSHTKVDGRAYSVFADYNRRGGTTVFGSSDGSLVGVYLT